ncbi:Pre-mRNA splicing factor family protein [Babesia bovis T2Bo]|uniref:Pre-mRNA splicing factor n=1 Tax=Babesia bovis TaxID=5865 RepID=A7AWP9_BABBO|nr:Pre-mRNA splicing factor family protein [Babesia bovis T2Bo]EDO05477.1 Pre-mRNA splicing factor family protein [Babesia bovis T2Bo]|eukprot:XP_001609045.1 hypothetical protein [Babesia bovis T2Bo]
MYDDAEASLVRDNNRQWTLSNRVEAEGLEWLYADPSANKSNANQLEEYLLGKSIEGARGEIGREHVDQTACGSLLSDAAAVGPVDQTLSKFREDPLFVIKKVELHQKQVLKKYESLVRAKTALADVVSEHSNIGEKSCGNRKSRSTRGHRASNTLESRRVEHDRYRSYIDDEHSSRKRSSNYRNKEERSSTRYRSRSRDSCVSVESYYTEYKDRSGHHRRNNRLHRERRSHDRVHSVSNTSVKDRRRDRARNRLAGGVSSGSDDSSVIVERRLKGNPRERNSHSSRCRGNRGGTSFTRHGSRDSSPTSRESHFRMYDNDIDSSQKRMDKRDAPNFEKYRPTSRKDLVRSDIRSNSSGGAEKVDTKLPAERQEHEEIKVSTKPKLGPQVPRKGDPLKYAFGVTQDILPPQAIQDRAARRNHEMFERERNKQKLYESSDPNDRLEQMQSHGASHLKERLEQMEAHESTVKYMEREDRHQRYDYISAVKKHAFESAKLSEHVRQRGSRTLLEDD